MRNHQSPLSEQKDRIIPFDWIGFLRYDYNYGVIQSSFWKANHDKPHEVIWSHKYLYFYLILRVKTLKRTVILHFKLPGQWVHAQRLRFVQYFWHSKTISSTFFYYLMYWRLKVEKRNWRHSAAFYNFLMWYKQCNIILCLVTHCVNRSCVRLNSQLSAVVLNAAYHF